MPSAQEEVIVSGTAVASRRHLVLRVAAVCTTVVLGALVAVQARINGELGRRVADGYLAAVISIGVGLVLLSLAVAATRPGREALGRWMAAVRSGTYPWWYFIGGACGSVLVLAQGLTAAILGVALFSVAVVAGQSLSGLVVDRQGLGSMQPKPVTAPRVAGTVLMVVAVVWAVSGQLSLSGSWAWLVLPLVGGLVGSFQQAINGQVRQITESILITTWANFAIAMVILVAAFVVHGLLTSWPAGPPRSWWLYLGGPLGITFVALASVLVHRIGVLLLGLCTTAGQLIGSLVLDVVVPPEGHRLAWTTVAGTVLALVAIGVTTWPGRRTAAAD